MLVMPQDIQAPKGRLILPQVQTLRNLLDKKCVITCITTDMFENALEKTGVPDLIITDSQVFRTVHEKKPEKSRLTSFSVVFAGYKGDIAEFVRGASAIGRLNENSRVLIAEACTHAPLAEDIGREKIPRMLRQRFGQGLKVDIVSGSGFPEDLSGYDICFKRIQASLRTLHRSEKRLHVYAHICPLLRHTYLTTSLSIPLPPLLVSGNYPR